MLLLLLNGDSPMITRLINNAMSVCEELDINFYFVVGKATASVISDSGELESFLSQGAENVDVSNSLNLGDSEVE